MKNWKKMMINFFLIFIIQSRIPENYFPKNKKNLFGIFFNFLSSYQNFFLFFEDNQFSSIFKI